MNPLNTEACTSRYLPRGQMSTSTTRLERSTWFHVLLTVVFALLSMMFITPMMKLAYSTGGVPDTGTGISPEWNLKRADFLVIPSAMEYA